VILLEEGRIFAAQPVLALLVLLALLAAPQEKRNEMVTVSRREATIRSVHFTVAYCHLGAREELTTAKRYSISEYSQQWQGLGVLLRESQRQRRHCARPLNSHHPVRCP
jgi:hypothetical protein